MNRGWVLFALFLGLTGAPARAAEEGPEGAIPSPFEEGTFLKDWVRTSLMVELRGPVLLLDGTRTKDRLGVFRDILSFTDVQMGAEFFVERRGRAGHCFGLAFASTDSHTYHALQIEAEKLSLIRVADGKTAEVLATKRIRDDEGKLRRLRFDQREGQVYASYQSEPGAQWQRLFDLRIPEPPAGRIGVYAEGARVEVRGLSFGGKQFPLKAEWKLVKP